MEARCTSESLTHLTTRRYIPENSGPNLDMTMALLVMSLQTSDCTVSGSNLLK